MRIVEPETEAALLQPVVPMAQLLLIRMPTGLIALNTSNMDVVWDGVTYLGAAGIGSIEPIQDASGEVQGLRLQLDGGDPLKLSYALDATNAFQGSPMELRTALFSATTYKIVDAQIDWAGYGDTFTINEDGKQATISATAEGDQVDLLRGHPLTATDADHQSVYAGDLAFEYVLDQVGKPVIWPTKEFFYQ